MNIETTALLQPILDSATRSINFFNGRLLSGEDLTTERTANRQIQSRLAQAVGAGIAYGLEVAEAVAVSTKTAPVVTVTKGLALNQCGQTLALAADTEVCLVPPSDP